MKMSYLLQVLLLGALILHSKAQTKCCNGILTPEERQNFVDTHNKLRSSLAKGNERNKNGNLMPKASNMLKLNYSCVLEKQAQKWADNCLFKHADTEYGENIFSLTTPKQFPISKIKETIVQQSCESWWGELKSAYPDNPTNILTSDLFDKGVGHFTQVRMLIIVNVKLTNYMSTCIQFT
ncbi:unnamed protein product [Thelazia callipaeda]|uniref:SCP domain-containing protein n=1 Tax=Thelazia callipaeda TaxID=103827 RepID=A0A0N5DB57_THECL|nr:unnamed protein product [Thelazia callipaeda]